MNNIITTILGVFTEVSEWFVGAIGGVTELFYVEGNLTFIGGLTVIGLAIAVGMMLLAMVRSYLQLKA